MAIILGKFLNAKAIYTSSAPVNLYTFCNVVNTHPGLQKNKDDKTKNKYKYYDLEPLLNSVPDLFYFYSAECDMDIEQAKVVEPFKHIYKYAVKSKSHGVGLSPKAWCSMLNFTKEQMLLIDDGVIRSPKELSELIISKSSIEFKDSATPLTTKNIQKLNAIDIIKSINKNKIIYGAGKYGTKLYNALKNNNSNSLLNNKVRITDANSTKQELFADDFIDVKTVMLKPEINNAIVLIAIENDMIVNEVIQNFIKSGWNKDNLFWSLMP